MSDTRFQDIPDEVWKLFEEILHHGKPVKLLDGNERVDALLIAWGWEPPLMKHGDRYQLTAHGLAAYSWRRRQRSIREKGEHVPPPDDWADYRSGPGGPLLTAKVCWDRFGVSNSVLSKDADKRPDIRRKNPHGRGFVYRYDVVAQIANRKQDRD